MKRLEDTYGKLTSLKPFNGTVFKNRNEKYQLAPAMRRQIADITDEEGLERAYASQNGLYQYYSRLFIAGTKDFPQDHIDD